MKTRDRLTRRILIEIRMMVISRQHTASCEIKPPQQKCMQLAQCLRIIKLREIGISQILGERFGLFLFDIVKLLGAAFIALVEPLYLTGMELTEEVVFVGGWRDALSAVV